MVKVRNATEIQSLRQARDPVVSPPAVTTVVSTLYFTPKSVVSVQIGDINRSAVQKSDFTILRTIGRGTYGKVYLV